MIILLVLAVLGAAALGLGLIALPILLPGSGALNALVRPDLMVVFGRPHKGLPVATLVATKRFVFVLHPEQLPPQGELLAWLNPPLPVPSALPSPVSKGTFDTLCRTRLSDPRTSVAEIEHVFATQLPPEAVLELTTLPSHHVETKPGSRGFHFARTLGQSQVVSISSQADALALQRFLAPGW